MIVPALAVVRAAAPCGLSPWLPRVVRVPWRVISFCCTPAVRLNLFLLACSDQSLLGDGGKALHGECIVIVFAGYRGWCYENID